ncbi:ring-cleaving dioxygenase [Chthonobacter rhizosphaerae]|uniref:ring-cleaving dioxygenase n=1 Tax=Chthonobacter rhizosphaerae TaxID=2735553 RepID=UPI0015EE4E85|nr:ring-cleaving dioxygenase [Chthonobacter rhizosphaerae]
MSTAGLHHVTAIAGPARRNLDIYTDLFGLRLVKRTVNFDDPGTYHFYYGDRTGSPGSILTFFPWAHAAPGRFGGGETHETAFRVPFASLGLWRHRLEEAGLHPSAPQDRFGDMVVTVADPDGMRLALVGVDGAESEPVPSDAVPADEAIRGLHSVTLVVPDAGATGDILTDVLGFEKAGEEGDRQRFRAPGAAVGAVVDLRAAPGLPAGRLGAGTVHHVAFRAADDDAQAAMVDRLRAAHGLAVTAQRDRTYFRSVYFREPGGVLFEIATDVPGFTVDEPLEDLGTDLKLPDVLEPRRVSIKARLPSLD